MSSSLVLILSVVSEADGSSRPLTTRLSFLDSISALSDISQQTVGNETVAFGLHFASVFPSTDILNGYVTNTVANMHVALSSHRNSHLYITFFHVL